MRYLQTYKLFESSWDQREDDLKILKDIFLELEDKDFIVSFYKTSESNKRYISIFISKNNDMEQFKWEDIEDTFSAGIEYIDDYGYNFEKGMLTQDDESITNRIVKNTVHFYDYESFEKELKSGKQLYKVFINYSVVK